jgi:hypothetical protein
MFQRQTKIVHRNNNVSNERFLLPNTIKSSYLRLIGGSNDRQAII